MREMLLHFSVMYAECVVTMYNNKKVAGLEMHV